MTRYVAAAFAIAALLILLGAIYTLNLWVDGQAAALAAEARLVDLRSRRLSPQETSAMKSALATPDPGAGLLLAFSDAEATSRLETAIEEVAGALGIESLALSIERRAAENGVLSLKASLRAIVQDENVGNFLGALEGGAPAMFFERLRLSRNPAADKNKQPTLEMMATLVVYWDHRVSGSSGI